MFYTVFYIPMMKTKIESSEYHLTTFKISLTLNPKVKRGLNKHEQGTTNFHGSTHFLSQSALFHLQAFSKTKIYAKSWVRTRLHV